MWVRNFSGSRTVTLRKGSWTLTSRPAPDDNMIDTFSLAATDRYMPRYRWSRGQGHLLWAPCGDLTAPAWVGWCPWGSGEEEGISRINPAD